MENPPCQAIMDCPFLVLKLLQTQTPLTLRLSDGFLTYKVHLLLFRGGASNEVSLAINHLNVFGGQFEELYDMGWYVVPRYFS